MMTYFGLQFWGNENYDYVDVAERLFVCYDIPVGHVQTILDMLGDGRLPKSQFAEMTDRTIAHIREDLMPRGDLYIIMRERLSKWMDIFGEPDESDYALLEVDYELSYNDLFKGRSEGVADEDNENDDDDDDDDDDDIFSDEEFERLGQELKECQQRVKTMSEEECKMAKYEGVTQSARALADYVKQYIKGQDDVIEQLSVPFFQHLDSMRKGYTCKVKSSVMMLGPTGTGKSEMLRLMADVCNCPVIFLSSSEVRPTGWKGTQLTSLLARELNNGVSLDRLKYAMIIIDEVDKIPRHNCTTLSSNGNDDAFDMMRDLMRILDVGHTLHIENGNNPMEGTPNIVELPTENLLVVFSGAFSGIEKIIQRRMRVGASMGFGATKSGDAEAENYMKYVTTEDLEEWGFLPEFLGRIGVFAVMNPLTVDTIVEIMKQAKGNILEGHVDYASHNNVDLRFSDEALRIIAEKAYASGLGFRNVKAILSEVMNRLYFTMSDGESGESRVVNVDREFMKNNLMTR